ncbi:MAG: hypothetical protein D6731_13920 [Planctomycetota bacterium]|nr:MAG: hypothetical protein D6731_13920 [Planctomycetota bacterium]
MAVDFRKGGFPVESENTHELPSERVVAKLRAAGYGPCGERSFPTSARSPSHERTEGGNPPLPSYPAQGRRDRVPSARTGSRERAAQPKEPETRSGFLAVEERWTSSLLHRTLRAGAPSGPRGR